MARRTRNEALAELVQGERRRRGLTVLAFAALLGVNRNTVASWEAGWSVPHEHNLRRLMTLRREPVAQPGFFPVRTRGACAVV